jgi:hypothetical protein
MKYNADVEDFNAREGQWRTNYSSALEAGREAHVTLTTREEQEQSATAQRITGYSEEGAIRAAEAEAGAAGSGITGNSVEEVTTSILGGAARNRTAARVNADNTAAQIALEQRGVVATTQNRINSITRPTKPNVGAAILKASGAFLGGLQE